MKMDILREPRKLCSLQLRPRVVFQPLMQKVHSAFRFLDDHAEDEILRFISECNDGSAWKFYFIFPPSERVKRELESTLSEEADMHLTGAHSTS